MLFPTQQEFKGLEAQIHCSKLNICTYLYEGKAVVGWSGYSFFDIKNAAYKPLLFIR